MDEKIEQRAKEIMRITGCDYVSAMEAASWDIGESRGAPAEYDREQERQRAQAKADDKSRR